MELKYLIFFILFAFSSCTTLLVPEYKFPLKDLRGVQQINVLLNCDEDYISSLPMTICDAGIKEGSYYCKDVKTFHCPPGRKILVTGFTDQSFPKLQSYLEYMEKRFKDVGTFQ